MWASAPYVASPLTTFQRPWYFWCVGRVLQPSLATSLRGWSLHLWTPCLSHISLVLCVPHGSTILNIFLLVIWTCSWACESELEGGDTSYRRIRETEFPVVRLSWFCVRLLYSMRPPPSLHQNLSWILFFPVPHLPFGTLIFKSSLFCCFYTIF